jgi:CRP-like cAMP-binding protein
MRLSTIPHNVFANKLLAALPSEEYGRLLPDLEKVHLPRDKKLYAAGEQIRVVYFPLNGMVSQICTTESGETVEVAMVGNEGVTGVSVALGDSSSPFEVQIQIPADALMIKAAALEREIRRGGLLQRLLTKYAHTQLVQVTQSVVCNRFHTVEKRLCRWLLVTRDKVGSDAFNLTHEAISHMLGSPRTVVTVAAVNLQDAGLIRYRRGKIILTNPEMLEAYACECYEVMKKEFYRHLAA